MAREVGLRCPLLAFVLLALPLAAAQAPVENGCSSSQVLEDPVGDTALWPAGTPTTGEAYAAPADVVRVELEQTRSTLMLRTTLAESPPRREPTETYRYWLGFDAKAPGKPVESWAFRIAHTTTYEDAVLVHSTGRSDLGRFQASWDEQTVSFSVDLALLRRSMGDPSIEFGAPSAGTDGPHRTDRVQGFVTSFPYQTDGAGGFHEFMPIVPCAPSPEASGPVMTPQATPTVTAAAVVSVLAGLAIATRRR